MEEKLRNMVIFSIAVVVVIVLSASFMGMKDEKKKEPAINKELTNQPAPLQTNPQQNSQTQNPQPQNEQTQNDQSQNVAQQTTSPDANQPSANSALSGNDSITTTNYANPQLNYFYYIPQSVLQNKTKRHPYLIMVPGLGGQGQGFVTQAVTNFADTYGFVIIAPSFAFDEKNFDGRTSYQYPAAWSGKALNDILNSFDSKQGLMPSHLYMLGFSAGAQFVLRYSLLYPNYVTACAVNAAGEADNPTKYQATKFFIAVGSNDEADRKQTAQKFFTLAQQQKIDIKYREYPNIAHQISDAEIADELSFFSNINAGAGGN